MAIHNLKINDEYAVAVLDGRKTFEVRRNDRDFNVGDELNMTYLKGDKIFVISCRVTYMFKSLYGLKSGYVIMGIDSVRDMGALEEMMYEPFGANA